LTNPSLRFQTSGNRELPEPPVVKAAHGIAQLTLIVNEDKATGQPEFVYDGMTGVAPTIDVKPGETIEINLKKQSRRPAASCATASCATTSTCTFTAWAFRR
jgi:hypothetical protein